MPSKKNRSTPVSSVIFKFSLTVLTGYLVFNMSVGFYFIIYPLIKRSADDFATLIQNNAPGWEHSSEQQRQHLSQHLLKTQNILFSAEPNSTHIEKSHSFLPYIYLLKLSLQARHNAPVQIDYLPTEEYQYLITLSGTQPLYIYFHRSRIGTSPPNVILSIFLSSLLVSILASYLLAQRIDKYFQPLIRAALRLSKGETPDHIEENGPYETQMLSRSFNNMSADVQQLLQNRTTLLAGVSHNLRTPVSRIKLGLELLPESTDAELKRKIDRSLNEIDQVIDQFLKMAAGMSTLDSHACSLNQTINEQISKFDHYSTNISFHPEFDFTCHLTKTAFEQILLNLIENSLRYAGNSSIEIVTEKNQQHLLVQVIDHGPGIPDEIRDNVFQPFVSHPPNNSDVPGGSGLGLAICQIMARAHKWELALDPVSSGGTCARLTLPLSLIKNETH